MSDNLRQKDEPPDSHVNAAWAAEIEKRLEPSIEASLPKATGETP